MPDLETRIQQAEDRIAQLQSILENTQQGLQKAEVAVRRVKRVPPVVMVMLSIAMAVSASLLATWLARRLRGRRKRE